MKTVQAPTAALRFHCAREDIRIKRHLFQGAHFSSCVQHTDTTLSKTHPCSRPPAQSRPLKQAAERQGNCRDLRRGEEGDVKEEKRKKEKSGGKKKKRRI